MLAGSNNFSHLLSPDILQYLIVSSPQNTLFSHSGLEPSPIFTLFTCQISSTMYDTTIEVPCKPFEHHFTQQLFYCHIFTKFLEIVFIFIRLLILFYRFTCLFRSFPFSTKLLISHATVQFM